MKITRRQLRPIIRESIFSSHSPCDAYTKYLVLTSGDEKTADAYIKTYEDPTPDDDEECDAALNRELEYWKIQKGRRKVKKALEKATISRDPITVTDANGQIIDDFESWATKLNLSESQLIRPIEEQTMKITRRQLRRIIKEELSRVIQETHSLERVDYERWATEAGHITPAASSVMASYFLDQGLEDDLDLQKKLTAEFYMDHQDVMRDMEQQRRDEPLGGWVGDALTNDPDYKDPTEMGDLIDTDGDGALDADELRSIADDLGEDEEDYPKEVRYTHPKTGQKVMKNVWSSEEFEREMGALLRQYPDLPYSVD